jgi:hypothetical protein
MTTVNVVAFENGVGNSRDLALISRALEALGCEVSVTRISAVARRRRRFRLTRAIVAGRRWFNDRLPGGTKRFDLNIMMEHIWPEQVDRARRNIVVPNPEWFDRADMRHIDAMDAVWTKTEHSHQALSRLGRRAEIIGFDSEDRYDSSVKREPGFFHLAGKSRMKGSGRLAEIWSRHADWPTLTVLHSRKSAFNIVSAPNIRYDHEYLHDSELKRIQNRYQFHLCLSETEGWGHYIPEALSVGAVVIATDAPPMNEIITSERGLLVGAIPVGRQHLATTYEFNHESLERVVNAALTMSALERVRLGDRARDWFIDNKRGFAARLGRALDRL